MRVSDKMLQERIAHLAKVTGLPFQWGHSNGYPRLQLQMPNGGYSEPFSGTQREVWVYVGAMIDGYTLCQDNYNPAKLPRLS